MEYLIFILLVVLLYLNWGTAREVECIHKMLRECAKGEGDEALAKALHESSSALEASIEKDQKV